VIRRFDSPSSSPPNRRSGKTVKREHGMIPRHDFCYEKPKPRQNVTEGGYNKAWRKARVSASGTNATDGPLPFYMMKTIVIMTATGG
jgi:hypothetical protein